MERYYNDDPDRDDEAFFGSNDDEDEEGDEEESEETVAYIDKEDIISVMQMDVAQTQVRQSLLDRAIKIAEGHWLWRFRSPAFKMNEVNEIYKNLLLMTEGEPDSEGEEEKPDEPEKSEE